MFRRIWCWLLGHDWSYVCSFTRSDGVFPYGGFRIRCQQCHKTALVSYPERMEFHVEREVSNG